MEGFSAVRGIGFRVLADYLVIHNDKAEPRPRRGFSFSARLSWPSGSGMFKQSPGVPVFCAACGNPMKHVRTIWRGMQADLEVFECRACGVSMTQAKTENKAT